jgi:hypothetical protein
MLTILGFKISWEALIFFSLFIGSEVIGLSKLRQNSVAQLFIRGVRILKNFRTEDDKIEEIKKKFY